MKALQVTMSDEKAKKMLSAHKNYLIEEGGCTHDEVKDISLENVFDYALYSHLEYIGCKYTALDFILVEEEQL